MARPDHRRPAMPEGSGIRAPGVRLPLALAMLAVPAAVQAQDIEPRADSNAPVGVNFLVGGYAFTRGGPVLRSLYPGQEREARYLERGARLCAGARPMGHVGEV